MTSKLSFALRYAEAGCAVLLLAPGSKLPFFSKANGGAGVHDATRDPDQIQRWWGSCPDGNVGLAMGEPSGTVAIDIDPRHGGEETVRRLVAEGRAFPEGPRQRTGNGGYHLLCRWQPGVRNSANKIGRGIDVKSTGGYILAAPSQIGPSESGPGGTYVWEVSPFDAPPPRMPIWMSTLLNPPVRPANSAAPDYRNHDASLSALEKFVAAACEGERNRRLYWAACRVAEMAGGAMSAQSAGRRLLAAARQAGYAGAEAIRTVNSAFRS